MDDDTDDGIDYDAPEPIKYLVEEYPDIPDHKMPLEWYIGTIVFVGLPLLLTSNNTNNII